MLMDLRKELLSGDFSKQYVQQIAKKINGDEELFDELIRLFLGNEYRVTQRAAWVVSHCYDLHPWQIERHLASIINNLNNPVNDAVKRNTVRILQFVDLPEDLMGIMADHCFSFIQSAKVPIAVKAHSMTILFNISKNYPELKDEVKIAIEDVMVYGSAGIKNRGRKILNKLDKMS